MIRRTTQLMTLGALNRICTWIDAVAYRPAVVKLTERLPRWWNCQLAHASMKLDDRWETGYWRSEAAPAAPNGPCDACGRRAAWLIVGGIEPEEDTELNVGEPDYLERHPVQLCGWCRLDFVSPPESREELDRILADARERSVSWHWR